MERVNYKRPNRAVVRCKAKMQLLQAAEHSLEWSEPVDDTLLKELQTTLFQSNQYQALFERCSSKQDLSYVEEQLVSELVETYQHIVRRQDDSIVQGLNALL